MPVKDVKKHQKLKDENLIIFLFFQYVPKVNS